MDWTRGGIDHSLRVVLVDPRNLSTVRGELEGVDPAGSLMLDYYSDLRMKAGISTSVPEGESDGWDGSAAMRLVHEAYVRDELVFTETLGTFLVTDSAPWSVQNGIRKTSYQLSSMLYGMSVAVPAGNFAAGAGAMAHDLMTKVCANTLRKFKMIGAPRDYKFGGTVVYPAGQKYLSIMFDLADKAKNRLSVDELGYITTETYVSPGSKSPSWEIDHEDDMFIGPLEGDDVTLSQPGRVVVVAKKDKSQITAASIAPSGTRLHEGVRGFRLDDVRELSDMTPFTKARAQTLADQYLNTATHTNEEVKHGMRYRPLREGQIELLNDGEKVRRWMVKSADLDLGNWTWKLTLVGGW